jgi:cytochrome c biogenesis protein CcdA
LENVFAYPAITLPAGEGYDLGNLEEGKLYERSFAIKNTGDSVLEIKSLKVGCVCVVIVYPRQKVKVSPGESIEAKFTFNTEGMQGEATQYIYIASSDPANPLIKLKLTAQVTKKAQAVMERFRTFGLFTILGAGLIDGINPCAFTILVFFISFLNFVGYKRRDLLILGITFILAVFITYILIGIGLFKFIQALEIFAPLSRIVYLAIAGLTIVLGIYSLYDCYIYNKTKNPDKIKLKLPDFIKRRTQKIIQDSSRDKNKKMAKLVATVFLSGFLISLLESICTGQTYVPTIAYVLRAPDLRPRALFYLVMYNLMFIAPLIIILSCGIAGVSSETFTKLTRKHLGTVKFLTALLFFSLAILLIFIKGGKV